MTNEDGALRTMIVDDEPLSARVHSEHEIAIARDAWRTRVGARAQLACDATTFPR